MIEEIIKSPVFGVTVTLIAFEIGLFLQNRTKSYVVNPMLIATSLIIIMLLTFKIPYQNYNEGGKYISFLLGPATVALAIPLYKNIDLILKYKMAIFVGILCGSVAGILSAALIASFLGADKTIALSLAPKSVTTPIAIEISNILKGYPSLTSAAVIITGIIGAMMGPEVLKIAGVNNKIAKGIAIGTAAHGLGTSRAVQEGEIEGAMSGLAIGLAGIITSLIIPFIVKMIL